MDDGFSSGSQGGDSIPFNRPGVIGTEHEYLKSVFKRGKFGGGGPFSKRCCEWLRENYGAPAALTTTSGTHALEMAALLCDLRPGDEVILPSFAFPTTASAFVRCGASLVFVDVDPATMNIDVAAVAAAITPRTRVIIALHYAGVSCDMDSLSRLATEHGAFLVEDAAQAVFSSYKRKPCGTIGSFGCLSFHESKNIHCGEGGALVINDAEYVERAEIIWEKGTDRSRFFLGQVDKYSWQELGSSYVLSELNSAFLLAQLEEGERITADRLRSWNEYASLLQPLADSGLVEVPGIPSDCSHNGHIYWIKTRSARE